MGVEGVVFLGMTASPHWGWGGTPGYVYSILSIAFSRFYHCTDEVTAADWASSLKNFRTANVSNDTDCLDELLVNTSLNTVREQFGYLTKLPNYHWWNWVGEKDTKVRFDQRFSYMKG